MNENKTDRKDPPATPSHEKTTPDGKADKANYPTEAPKGENPTGDRNYPSAPKK